MKKDAQIVYAFSVPLIFPEGLSVGSSGKNNKIEIERNGRGNPVLRGSSLAGVFRSEITKYYDEDKAAYFFGRALDRKEERQESRVVFFDLEFANETEESMHNLICRHTGSVSTEDKGLFSLERIASGSVTVLRFYFRAEKDWEDNNRDLISTLIKILQRGLSFGGSQARGTGRALVNGNSFQMKRFDLETEDGFAGFLGLTYADNWDWKDGETIPAKGSDVDETLAIDVVFGIPRGQDILCSEGNSGYPVTASSYKSGKFWKIPGSTIRGVFRGWFSRFAARDGEKLSDSAENFRLTRGQRAIDLQDEENDPVSDLFGMIRQDGSSQKKGRIHISDALSDRIENGQMAQFRMHVAIDSFSGGTNPGRLFSNYVLTDPDGKLAFRSRISISEPKQKEADWLKKTLEAVQLGLIRFGSSKASGRLEIRSIELVCKPEDITFNTQIERN